MGVVICVHARVTDNPNFIRAGNNSGSSDNVGLKFGACPTKSHPRSVMGFVRIKRLPSRRYVLFKMKNLISAKVVTLIKKPDFTRRM